MAPKVMHPVEQGMGTTQAQSTGKWLGVHQCPVLTKTTTLGHHLFHGSAFVEAKLRLLP
jgi:hypothetical protein